MVKTQNHPALRIWERLGMPRNWQGKNQDQAQPPWKWLEEVESNLAGNPRDGYFIRGAKPNLSWFLDPSD